MREDPDVQVHPVFGRETRAQREERISHFLRMFALSMEERLGR